MSGKGSKARWKSKSQSQCGKPATSSHSAGNDPCREVNIPVHPKLQKRFYEAVVLLNVLSKSQGDHIDEDPLDKAVEPSDLINSCEIRRNFLKQLAYICDSEKGGDTTTAMAAEQTPQGIVLWIASNKCSPIQEEKVKNYLDGILHKLRHLQKGRENNVEQYIISESVGFCSTRLKDYQNLLKKPLRDCINHFKGQSNAIENEMVTWLKLLQDPSLDALSLCRVCYESRNSSVIQELTKLCGEGMSCDSNFKLVRHYVGRLSLNLKAAKLIVHAALQLPQMFDDIKVSRVESSSPSPPPLQERNPTLLEIIGRMTSSADDIKTYRQAIEELDYLYKLSPRLKELCQSHYWKPRVHAELLILNHFYTQNLEFAANDRYIATSKPACHFCYHYILAHPGCFVPPACHNNTYPNWRAPDIISSSPGAEEAVKLREGILNEMVQKIRIAALKQIVERRGPRDRQFDSTTGFSNEPGRASRLGMGPEIVEGDFSDTDSLFPGGAGSVASDVGFEVGVEGESQKSRLEIGSDESDSDAGGVPLY